ncbi:lysine transporter LysE [Rhodoferax lacus]|uniref:Lysine transporter LysE n=1 Tax=Rhodoferax lacus TaxID=2184758 RepID=A0A3E1R9S2_9BURK|nr:LysE family translocator [Rhodoferax lacus]RFO96114.1 lysine transporter LysE [Rhodoferax lacus]
MPLDQLLLFIAAGLLLNLTPGPDVLYIISQSLRHGLRAGLIAALGITAGCFVHIFAAAVGVSALMLASSTAFTVLKWLGAGYLVYVGTRMLFSQAPMVSDSPLRADAGEILEAVPAGDVPARHSAASGELKTIFLRGFWTNALNPKVAVFFLAFLPQFIAPTVEHKPLAFLLLGLLFNFNAVWVNLGWAVAAVWLAQKAGGLQARMHWLDRVAGSLFIAFGCKLALTDNPAS